MVATLHKSPAGPSAPSTIGPDPSPAATSTVQSRWRRIVEPLAALVRTSKGHGSWIAIWSLIGWVGTLLIPVLHDHPFLLMLLSPRTLVVTLASGATPLAPFVLLGTLRLCIADGSYYVIGRRAPALFAERQRPPVTGTLWRRAFRQTDRFCRWLAERPGLAFVVLFLRPNARYMALGGAYGVRAFTAASAAILGTMTYLTAIHLGANLVF